MSLLLPATSHGRRITSSCAASRLGEPISNEGQVIESSDQHAASALEGAQIYWMIEREGISADLTEERELLQLLASEKNLEKRVGGQSRVKEVRFEVWSDTCRW